MRSWARRKPMSRRADESLTMGATNWPIAAGEVPGGISSDWIERIWLDPRRRGGTGMPWDGVIEREDGAGPIATDRVGVCVGSPGGCEGAGGLLEDGVEGEG